MLDALRRAGRMARREGLSATARTAMSYLQPGSSWAGRYVWYALDLADPDRPRRPLDPAVRLFRATEQDIPLYLRLPSAPQVMGPDDDLARTRLAEGASLWLVSEGDEPAFACWNFRGTAPLAGAAGHRMTLPEDVVLLEDSLASPAFRGRGIAPGAWAAIADANARDGQRAMLTKVREDNASSCRAVEKAGFRPVAHMDRTGPDWRTRIAVSFVDDPPQEPWLASVNRRR